VIYPEIERNKYDLLPWISITSPAGTANNINKLHDVLL
jgi:hypothetical protein